MVNFGNFEMQQFVNCSNSKQFTYCCVQEIPKFYLTSGCIETLPWLNLCWHWQYTRTSHTHWWSRQNLRQEVSVLSSSNKYRLSTYITVLVVPGVPNLKCIHKCGKLWVKYLFVACVAVSINFWHIMFTHYEDIKGNIKYNKKLC